MAKRSTPAGNVLLWIAGAAMVVIIGWMLWSLPGWLQGWRLNRITGLIVLVGLGAVIFVAVPVAVAAVYSVIGMALEGLGVQINYPDPPQELTDEEEARAAATKVHPVFYAFTEEDSIGYEFTRAILVALHANRESAEADRAARSGPPPGTENPNGHWEVPDRPWNLLRFTLNRSSGSAIARELLHTGRAEIPPENLELPYSYRGDVPITREEFRRAKEIQVWTVYYEDRFSGSDHGRSSYPVAICFSADDAEAEVKRLGPIEPRSTGHEAVGPSPLVANRNPEIGAEMVREIMRRMERGERKTIPLREAS